MLLPPVMIPPAVLPTTWSSEIDREDEAVIPAEEAAAAAGWMMGTISTSLWPPLPLPPDKYRSRSKESNLKTSPD